MGNDTIQNNIENQKTKYIKPSTEKHEPVKIIQGSGDSSYGLYYYYYYCSYLYYVSLYYY